MTEFAQAITSSNSYPPSLSGYSTSNSDEESLVQFTYSQSVINQVCVVYDVSYPHIVNGVNSQHVLKFIHIELSLGNQLFFDYVIKVSRQF